MIRPWIPDGILPVLALIPVLLGISPPSWADDPAEARAADAMDETAAAPEPEGSLSDPDDIFLLGQDYLKNLGPYQPMYFLFGTPLSRSKFQLSFKYRFFNKTAPLVLKHPWVSGIHFGYTQTSFWDLESDSKPFEDTSYKPELFYMSRNVSWRPSAIDRLYFQAGVHHESNGRGEEASRSTNMVYVSSYIILRLPNSRMGFGIVPKLKYYLNNSEGSNPDIEDYRGWAEVEIGFGREDSLLLRSTIRTAKRGTSVEINATYPMSRSWFENIQIYLQVQYADALAEKLLDYRERHKSFRIGIAFYH
jgi:phospholipase A1